MVNQTPEIIGKFPNTYTFTKNLSERILKILKEKHTITIARPSIIGSSNRDPIPGWVDTVSAGGANYFLGGFLEYKLKLIAQYFNYIKIK